MQIFQEGSELKHAQNASEQLASNIIYYNFHLCRGKWNLKSLMHAERNYFPVDTE